MVNLKNRINNSYSGTTLEWYEKQKHHDKVFEDELKKMYEFGKEMVNNHW